MIYTSVCVDLATPTFGSDSEEELEGSSWCRRWECFLCLCSLRDFCMDTSDRYLTEQDEGGGGGESGRVNPPCASCVYHEKVKESETWQQKRKAKTLQPS